MGLLLSIDTSITPESILASEPFIVPLPLLTSKKTLIFSNPSDLSLANLVG